MDEVIVEKSIYPFARSMVRVEEVSSTNDLAKILVEDPSLPLPVLVRADRQTRGRGQNANEWWSDAGSLVFTLGFDPVALGLTIDQGPTIGMATATAVAEAILSSYPACPVGIRWPNDIEAVGRKLGGILSESVPTHDGPRHLVGVGLNVRSRVEVAPEEVRRMATSLGRWATSSPDPDPLSAILRAILSSVGPAYRDLAVRSDDLVGRWNRLDLLAGCRVQIQVGDELVNGVAAGIDGSGGLRIFQGGRTSVLYAGRVRRD